MTEYIGFYNEYKHAIYTYFLYRVAFDRQIAEDLTSDVFLRAYEAFGSFDKSRPFKPWIYRIAHNILVNHYRDTKPAVSISELEEGGWEIPDSKAERQLRAGTEQMLILQKFKLLSSRDADLLTMRYVHQLDHNEIGEIMEMNEGAVRTAVSRAMEKLKSIYEPGDE